MRTARNAVFVNLRLSLLLATACFQAWLSGVAATPIGNPGTADFFVSPRGKDTWSGKPADPDENDGPFATVARVREAVQELLKTQKESRRVRVVLRGGTYYLDSPLEFVPEDSGTEKAPVVYAAAAGEKVVLSGGRRLKGGRWGEVNGRKAWVVDIPNVKEGQWRFRQLFVNGARRLRTRLPGQGEYRIESLPGYTGDFLRSPTKQFVYAPGHIVPAWRNLQDVEIVGITRWLDNRLPIESVSALTRTVTFDRPSLFALLSGSEPGSYWVENVFEALDTPGQWYLDRPRGVLYYLPLPGEEMASAEMIAPRLQQVLRVVGRADAPVHDLDFEGLIFAHTEWQPPADYASSLQAGIEVPGALLFDYAERCAVTGGGIEHVGNYGIEVNVGCSEIEIARNQITDIGAGGIRIGHFFSWETDGSGQLTERGRQRKAAMPTGPHSQRITVADNEIAHCGRFSPEAVGVFVGDNANNKVIHNHIYDLFYSGISVGSVQDFGPSQATGNIIEYNHVHDIGQGLLSDLGAIYTCSSPDTRIRYNLVHDVSRRDYGGWGIYLDEGSHDLLVQKNLIFRCQDGGLFAHRNHDITAENNIFAFNRTAQVDRGGSGGFELTCRRNLICFMEGKAVGDYGSEHCGRDVCAFDHNLYWNASGKPVLFGKKTFSEWQAVGQDKNSLIADPLFVDPEKGDFRQRSGSPAAQFGFEPWDFSAIGPRYRFSGAGGNKTLSSPSYSEDIALPVRRSEFTQSAETATRGQAARSSDKAPLELEEFFAPPEKYRSDFGDFRSPLLFADGTPVRSPADWQRRRAEILSTWHKIMGPWPPLIERPRVEVVNTTRRENITQQQLRIEIALGGEMVDALLLVPNAEALARKRPAVLVVYYDAETGVGLGAPLRDYGWQLARRGFVTLSIGKPNAHIDVASTNKPRTEPYLGPVGKPVRVQPLSALAYAAANAHTVLAQRPEVQPDRIGIVGHSFGGKWAMFASCLYDKFACAVWSDPGIVFDERDRRQQNPSGSVNYWDVWYLGFELGVVADPQSAGPFRKLPSEGQLRTGAYKALVEGGHDLVELHALMAPRPFLISGGTADLPERWPALNHAVAVNRRLGYDHRVAMTTRGGHSPTEEANKQVYRFFEWCLSDPR